MAVGPGPNEDQEMSQETPEQERLSGTAFGALRDVALSLGWLSATLTAVAMVCLVVGIALLFFEDLRLYTYIVLGIGGGFLLAAMVISYATVGRAVTSRRGRYSTNTIVMVAAFIGIVAVANFLAFENSARLDVTATKQLSLAPQTVQILKDLEEPVEAKGFFVPGRTQEEQVGLSVLKEQVNDVLREFEIRTGKFSYDFVDPVSDPQLARNFGVTEYPTIVFEAKESQKHHRVVLRPQTTPFMEQDFVTGFLIVTGQEQKRVYFLTGHGERDIDDAESDTGFSAAHRAIRADNYAVDTVNLSAAEGKDKLLGTETGDGRAHMLVIAAPNTELPDSEAEILQDYLKDGGNLLFLAEPDTPQSFKDFLARWGMIIGDGHIVDLDRSAQGAGGGGIVFLMRDQGSYLDNPQQIQGTLAEALGTWRITGPPLAPLGNTFYAGVAPIIAVEEPVVAFFSLERQEGEEPEEDPHIFATPLGVTSLNSWLIEDPSRDTPDESLDRRDLYFPAVAVRAFAPVDEEPPESPNPAALVIFGDSDFATNRHVGSFNNGDIFLNSVNWLAGDIPLANIRPKPFSRRELLLTSNEFDFVRYSGWLLLPALMVVAGGFFGWRRR